VLEEMLAQRREFGANIRATLFFSTTPPPATGLLTALRGLPGALRGPLDDLLRGPQDLSADHCEYNGEIKPPLESLPGFPPRSAKPRKP